MLHVLGRENMNIAVSQFILIYKGRAPHRLALPLTWMLGVKHCWMVRFSHVILILHLNKRSHWTGQCFGVGHYKPLQPHRFLTDTSRIIMFSMSMRFEPLQTMRLNYTKTGFLFSLCQLALAMWHVSWV